MIGIWGSHAQAFLLALTVVTSAVFALPIFFVPLAWARRFGWRIPEHTDLAVYFGRCLGAFILIVELLMLRGGNHEMTIDCTCGHCDAIRSDGGLWRAVGIEVDHQGTRRIDKVEAQHVGAGHRLCQRVRNRQRQFVVEAADVGCPRFRQLQRDASGQFILGSRGAGRPEESCGDSQCRAESACKSDHLT